MKIKEMLINLNNVNRIAITISNAFSVYCRSKLCNKRELFARLEKYVVEAPEA